MDFSLPLPYPYTEDRDILWGKQVWERMDLDERFNLPLYYPTDTLASMPNVRSLFDALYHGISSGKITKIYIDSYFTQKLTLDEIKERMSAINITDIGIEQLADAGIENDQYETPEQINKLVKDGILSDEYVNRFQVNSENIEELPYERYVVF